MLTFADGIRKVPLPISKYNNYGMANLVNVMSFFCYVYQLKEGSRPASLMVRLVESPSPYIVYCLYYSLSPPSLPPSAF